MYLSQQEIELFIKERQAKLATDFTVMEEQEIFNHYCNILIQDLLKSIKPLEVQLTFLSYSTALFKRFFLHYTIFEQEAHQIALICTYLGMKLDEAKQDDIMAFAEELKKKPKHSKYVHFGDDSYAKLEMIVIGTLDYKIFIKPLFSYIVSLNFILKIQEYLKLFLFNAYMIQVNIYFHRALQNFTMFAHHEATIGMCCVELALLQIVQELQQPSGSVNVGPSNRPVDQLEQKKLKDLYQEHQSSGHMLIQMIASLNQQESMDILERINEKKSEMSQLMKQLSQCKDTPKAMDWSRFRTSKSEQFPHPLGESMKSLKYK